MLYELHVVKAMRASRLGVRGRKFGIGLGARCSWDSLQKTTQSKMLSSRSNPRPKAAAAALKQLRGRRFTPGRRAEPAAACRGVHLEAMGTSASETPWCSTFFASVQGPPFFSRKFSRNPDIAAPAVRRDILQL